MSKALVFANFGMGKGKTDTDCIFGSIGSCFPANTYDVSNEYSRVAFIPSGNFFFGGTFIIPKLKVNLNPFVVWSTGRAFNIVTGRDTNGDGLFTERPAFASAQTDPENLRQTRFGDFDLNPAPGQELIPRNYGLSPILRHKHRYQQDVRIWQYARFPVCGAARLATQPPASKPAAGSSTVELRTLPATRNPAVESAESATTYLQ